MTYEEMANIPSDHLRKIADRHRCNPYYEMCHHTDSYYHEIDRARFVLQLRETQPDRFPEPTPGHILTKQEYTRPDGAIGWRYA